MIRLFFAALLLAASAESAPAATYTLETGDREEFDDIYKNFAVADDTIVFPPCDVTWDSGYAFTKRVKIRGAGMDSSIIRISRAPNTSVWLFQNGTSPVTADVLDIGFIVTITSNSTYGFYLTGRNNRIGRVRFTAIGAKLTAIRAAGGSGIRHPTGVVYRCEFINARVLVQGDLRTSMSDSFGAGGLGRYIWANVHETAGYGDANTMFFEDCLFHNVVTDGNLTDAGSGGHYVLRHSTLKNGGAYAHGVTGLAERGTRKVEIYRNRFIHEPGFALRPDAAITPRGGSGVVFGNRFAGAWNYGHLSFSNEGTILKSGATSATEFTGTGVSTGIDTRIGWYILNLTDGSKGVIVANTTTSATVESLTDGGRNNFQSGDVCLIWKYDENPKLDQIGRGADAALWTPIDAWPRPEQDLERFYEWDNKLDDETTTVAFTTANGYSRFIQEGRDWHAATPKPGYTPYVYPHPLRDDNNPTKGRPRGGRSGVTQLIAP